jgi:hypothetical protein
LSKTLPVSCTKNSLIGKPFCGKIYTQDRHPIILLDDGKTPHNAISSVLFAQTLASSAATEKLSRGILMPEIADLLLYGGAALLGIGLAGKLLLKSRKEDENNTR